MYLEDRIKEFVSYYDNMEDTDQILFLILLALRNVADRINEFDNNQNRRDREMREFWDNVLPSAGRGY